jgi:hypothetical protein
MTYFIIIEDHIKKESKFLKSMTDKYNSIYYIDSYISTYLEALQGNIELNGKVFKNKNEYTKNKDCYIVVKKNDIMEKRTIYHKQITKGILYNVTSYIKMFTISIAYNKKERPMYVYDSRGYLYDYVEYKLDKVFDELESLNIDVQSDHTVKQIMEPNFLSPIII